MLNCSSERGIASVPKNQSLGPIGIVFFLQLINIMLIKAEQHIIIIAGEM